MTLQEILAVLKTGTVFIIKTEKTIEMAVGAPCRFMNKVSSYSVTTNIGNPTQTWWVPTEYKNIAMKGKRHYLLCKMASVVFGSSEFHPVNNETGDISDEFYTKREIARWLPVAGAFEKDTVLTLPIDSIISLELYKPKVEKMVGSDGIVNLSSPEFIEQSRNAKLIFPVSKKPQLEPYTVPEGIPNGY